MAAHVQSGMVRAVLRVSGLRVLMSGMSRVVGLAVNRSIDFGRLLNTTAVKALMKDLALVRKVT